MYKILIVDDKEIFCRSLMRLPYFRDNPGRFTVAAVADNGIDALRILRSTSIDITLTDIRMPLMNGIELLRTIQKEGLCPYTVIMSEYARFSYAREALIAGAFDYLVKPIDENMIETVLNAAYEKLNQQNGAGDIPEELVACIMNGDSEQLEEKLRSCEKVLLGMPSDSLAVRTVIENLSALQAAVEEKYAYINLYLPSNEMLLSRFDIQTRQQAADILALSARLAQRVVRGLRTSSDHPMIQTVWYYVISHIEESCRLQELADRFYINKNYLSTLFRKETGTYYKDFLLRFRTERAKLLLAFTDMKVYQIAEQLLFSDVDYFSKSFKSRTGISPSDYGLACYTTEDTGRIQEKKSEEK